MTDSIHAQIGGIQRFSTEDGPGIRTTVFLKGCPLSCIWCHNPELISAAPQIMFSPSRCIACAACLSACPYRVISAPGEIDRDCCRNCGACLDVCYARALHPAARRMSVGEVMAQVRRDADHYRRSGGGLTISGGELLSQPGFSAALLQAALDEQIPVALDTCGYGDSAALLALARQAEMLLYDIKLMDDAKHKRFTGVGNRLILDNLRMLAAEDELRRRILIRLPLLAGINDSDADAEAVGSFQRELGLFQAEMLPYHSLGRAKSAGLGRAAADFAAPTAERLQAFAAILAAYGITATLRD